MKIGGNMKRLDYETLAMREIIVEMENGFLAASKEEIEDDKYSVKIQKQTEGTEDFKIEWD